MIDCSIHDIVKVHQSTQQYPTFTVIDLVITQGDGQEITIKLFNRKSKIEWIEDKETRIVR